MRRITMTAISFVLSLTLVISGCASKSNVADKSSTNSLSSSETSSPGGTDGHETVKLSFLSWDHGQEQFQPILDAFAKKYPNIKIDLQSAPGGDPYNQKLNILLSSGEAPDIFYDAPPIDLHAKNGYLMDLTGIDALKDLPDKFKNAYLYEGKSYAFAPDAWVGGVFYNKKLFAKAGVSVPKTWDEFLQVSKKLQGAGIKPLAVSNTDLADYLYWLYMNDTLTKDPAFDKEIDQGKHTYTEGYLNSLQSWNNELVKTGLLTKDMVGINDDQRMDEFATEKAAMTITGPWAIKTFRDKNPNLDFDTFPLVGKDPNVQWNIGAINVGLAISAKTKHKDEAVAFLNFLASDEGLQLYQKMTGNILGIKRSIDYKVDPVMEKNKQIAINGTFDFPPVDWKYGSTISPILGNGLQDILLGGIKPEELLKSMDDKWKQVSKS